LPQPLTAERLGRLGQLLDAALALDVSDRAAWLDTLVGEDTELRPVVAELLSRADSLDAENFLGTLPKLGEAGPLAPDDGEHRPGDVVGPYRLERELGRGGMGTVWLAERIDKTLKRKVALKLPHQGFGRAQLVQRLARERDILSALEHPNIARLYDAGVAEDGQPFLALEYVEGIPIDVYASEQALDLRQRLGLFVQVCRAIAYAHTHLVLHRDLKPSNILVTENGEVRLLDFGVAKLLQDGSAEETELTRLGGRALTPEYASPEQISAQPLTTASDIYSLGVVLYELVCGQRPYKLKRDSMGALEDAILVTDPPRPSRVATAPLRRELGGDVDTIVLKMLEKVPGARFPTATAIIDDVERFLAGQPVLARPTSAWYRARKFIRRHRLLAAAAAAVVTAVLLGAGAALWQARVARQEAKRAEAAAREARFEAQVARGNHDFLSQIFGDAMRGGETTVMRGRLDRARDNLRRRYSDEPVIHALLLLQLAGRYAELNLNDREAEVMKEFSALAESTGNASLLATRECIEAYDALMAGDIEKARPHVSRGLSFMKATPQPLSDADFECLRADSMLAMRTGDNAHAVASMQQLLSRLEADGLTKTQLYLASLGSLAYVYLLGGQYAEALEVSRKKIALDDALGSDQTIGAYAARDNASELLFGLGRISEACAWDERLLADFRGAGETGEVPPDYLINFARHAVLDDDVARAIPWLEGLVTHYEKAGPPNLATGSRLELADAELRSGRPKDAEAQLLKADTLMAATPPSPRTRIQAARIRLTLAARGADRAAVMKQLDALRVALKALPDAAHTPPAVKVTVLTAQLEAGRVLLREAELDAATLFATEALALGQSATLPGKTSAWVGAATLLLGQIDAASGRPAPAQARALEAERDFSDTLSTTHPLRVAAQALAAGAPGN
jgi:tRNA A-37 threonylcarbamoyl transferase component Bud32/tetratricopeptide (TPR) repeat protein